VRRSTLLLLLVGACGDAGSDDVMQTDGAVQDAEVRAADAGDLDTGMDAGDAASAAPLRDAQVVHGEAGGPCRSDAHEPDDTPAEAMAKQPLSGIRPIDVPDLVACAGESDWFYAGLVDMGGKAAAELTWDPALGSVLGLALYDQDMKALPGTPAVASEPGKLQLSVDEFYGKYFYVAVTSHTSVTTPYSLRVTAQVFGP
jgi:hypothetical protein